jgi:hypothetical protein
MVKSNRTPLGHGDGASVAPSPLRDRQRAVGARSLRRRADQRGAAVFVVVMVLTMLSAIGVFAMRAASMANLASGFDRQNTQNHYVGEYGLLAAVAELSTTRRSAYVDKMAKGADICSAAKGMSTVGTAKVPCYQLFANDVAKTVASNYSGRPLFESPSGSGSSLLPGSLGPVPLDGDFVVEMTDPGPVGLPVAGTDVGGSAAKFRYMQVTLTSVGQVRPGGDPACTAGAVVAGNETGRAFVVIGPMP